MSHIRLLESSFFLLAGALTLVLIAAPPARAQQDIAAAIVSADRMNEEGDYTGAVEILRPVLELHPDNYDLLRRIADNLTEWARIESKTATKEESEAIYAEAVTYARHAVEVNDSDAEGWYQLGKALGRLALFRGGKEKVNMSKEIKEDFEKAISLDPEHASAIHGLARWHREVANLSGILKLAAKILYGGLPPASNEEAVRLFQRALSLEPDDCVHHLELGKTYLEMKDKEKAAEEFETVLRLPAVEPDDPEWKEEAEQLLAKIRK